MSDCNTCRTTDDVSVTMRIDIQVHGHKRLRLWSIRDLWWGRIARGDFKGGHIELLILFISFDEFDEFDECDEFDEFYHVQPGRLLPSLLLHALS